MGTIAQHVIARAGNGDRTAILFEDQTITWGEYVDACATRAAYLQATLDPEAPPHVGVLFENIPEFPMWLGAAALAGAVVVGINPTRRGAELAREDRKSTRLNSSHRV